MLPSYWGGTTVRSARRRVDVFGPSRQCSYGNPRVASGKEGIGIRKEQRVITGFPFVRLFTVSCYHFAQLFVFVGLFVDGLFSHIFSS